MMRKAIKKVICSVLLMFALAAPAMAETGDAQEAAESQAAALEADEIDGAVPEDASDLLGGIEMSDGLDFADGLGEIFDNTKREFGGILAETIRNAAVIMVVAILCALAGSVYDGGGSDAVPNYVVLVGFAVVGAVTMGSGNTFIGLGRETLSQLTGFSKVLLPILATAAAAGGAVTSAAAKYAATMLFLDVLFTIADRVVMPLIYGYIAVSIGNAAFGGDALGGAANLLKWMANMIMLGITAAFIAYISVTGVIAGGADDVTAKVAKTTISAALPVVGGIISDAASSVVAGAGILRNTIGVFGILSVLAICILPFLRLGANFLFYKLAAGLTMAIADRRIAKLIDSLGTAFGMVLGLVGAGGIMLFFSIFSLIKVVTGA